MIGHYWCKPCGVKVTEDEMFLPLRRYDRVKQRLSDGLGAHTVKVEVRPGETQDATCGGPIFWKAG